jgi:hypothetical protein
LLTILFLCVATPASAHQLSVTYIDVAEQGNDLDISLAIDPHATPLAAHIDTDGDGIVSREEIAAGREALVAFTFGRLRVTAPRGSCTPDPPQSESVSDLGVWQARAHYACPSPAAQAQIVVGFLPAMPEGHRAIARIMSGGVLQQQLLDRDQFVIDAREQDWLHQGLLYVRLGIWHILSGLDHVAFVIGLVLGARGGLRKLVVVLTAFTIAHSITLILAGLEVVSLPSRWVETTIALSIAIVAAANLWRRAEAAVAPRAALAFGFGLVHGLGFADILQEAHLHGAVLVGSLLFFNVGIELGQLGLVALLWPLVQRAPEWARRAAGVALLALGLGWAGLRALS